MRTAAILDRLLTDLADAADRAAATNPVTVFESLLTAVVVIVMLGMGLRHIYLLKKLESLDRRAELRVLQRLNLPQAEGVDRPKLLRWLRKEDK